MADLDKILGKIMAACELLKESADALGEPEPVIEPEVAEDPQHYAIRALQQQVRMQRNPHWGLQNACEHAAQVLISNMLRYKGASLRFKDTELPVPPVEPPQVAFPSGVVHGSLPITKGPTQ